jgi:serine/threonine-protein kinase HipA
LEKTFVTHQRLHPLLSNLLPEGALRELIASSLKLHIDNEFQLLAALGHDLPGALLATQVNLDEIPDVIKYKLQISDTDQVIPQELQTDNKFSLAGVQMKFSMKAQDGHFTLAHGAESAIACGYLMDKVNPHLGLVFAYALAVVFMVFVGMLGITSCCIAPCVSSSACG